MDARLQQLLDKDRIRDTVNQLFIGTDNRDWPTVRACFAAQVLFDMTSVTGEEPLVLTPEQITDGWEQGLGHLEAVHHQTGNYRVQIHGGEADAFCYGIASHYLPNRTGSNTRVFVGSYSLHLVQEAGDWRIDRFQFTLKYRDGNQDLEAHR